MTPLHKYPRTQHLKGSRLQPGDEDLDAVPWKRLAGRHLVVEEKMDGANSGLRFSPAGQLLLQSRGHYLSGGVREKHFARLKQWATTHAATLWDRLGDRYLVFGEWLYAKHTIFYDCLPHYFLEFDILDTVTGDFLSTPRRAELLAGLPVLSVRVLFTGSTHRQQDVTGLLGGSAFIRPGHRDCLREEAQRLGLDPDHVLAETDRTTLMEGLYIKVEEGDRVVERYKFIRHDFLTAVLQSDSHWLHRPIVPNLLAPDVDLFARGEGTNDG